METIIKQIDEDITITVNWSGSGEYESNHLGESIHAETLEDLFEMIDVAIDIAQQWENVVCDAVFRKVQ